MKIEDRLDRWQRIPLPPKTPKGTRYQFSKSAPNIDWYRHLMALPSDCIPMSRHRPKRARASVLDDALCTLEVPRLGNPNGLLVLIVVSERTNKRHHHLADGTRLVSTPPTWARCSCEAEQLALIVGDEDEDMGLRTSVYGETCE